MTDTTDLVAPLPPDAVALLRRYGGVYAQRALTALAAWQVASPYVQRVRKRLLHHDTFTVTVFGNDEIYPDLHDWVLARMTADDRKALIVSTQSFATFGDEFEDSRPKLRLRYDGDRMQELDVQGHQVTVHVVRDADADDDEEGKRSRRWGPPSERVVLSAQTSAGRDAVLSVIEGLVAERFAQKGPPPLMIPTRWGGGWQRRTDIPPRSFDSVILKEGQIERLRDDLSAFLRAENDYARLSQPWHRGYLFHGAPGTGKTSAARALANEFGLPTYFLPLGDLESDADLMSLVGSVQPRSILLIEDVDVFHAATTRDDRPAKASVAAMLNALDGIWTPHGLITILTTNHREALDPALVRAGRIDVEEEFTCLDRVQARRMADWLGVDRGADIRYYDGREPAEMIQGLWER